MEHSVPPKNFWLGTVVAVQANFYRVKLDRFADTLSHEVSDEQVRGDLLCTRRAILKKWAV
ncbi:MAG: hypothetical protein HC810_03005, partial [Acaryochloridaceae cyanobacterium RL_2_7]|nr:hypothetical protein [Acaryochloridaceae cyanobacterium RL_2_7]